MIQKYYFDRSTEEGKKEWLEFRKKYIGGSDAATIVNLNPFSSQYALWCEKTGKTEGFKGNLATEVGSYLEEFVAELFEKQTGKKVRRNNATMVNDKYPWALADVDREIVGEDAILEIKTTSELNLKKFANGEYPANYYVQVMSYLAVCEKQKGYLAVLIGNRDFKVFEIERDENEIRALMEQEKFFMQLVEGDIPPLADGSEASAEALSKVYPKEIPGAVTDISIFRTEMQEYCELGERIKELNARRDEIANVIKGYLGNCESGVTDGFSVSYKTQTRSSFDEKAFLADHRGIDLSQYKKTTTSRVFRLTEKKSK